MITEEQFEDYKKRLKENIHSRLKSMQTEEAQKDKTSCYLLENLWIKPIFEEIDNLSIHSPQTKPLLENTGQDGVIPVENYEITSKDKTADNEPESVGSNCLYKKQSCKNRIPSGSSNLCKCGHPLSCHVLDDSCPLPCNYTESKDNPNLYKCKCKKFEHQGEGCGKEFVDETGNDVTCGEETDYWDEDTRQTFWRTPICPECKKSQGERA